MTTLPAPPSPRCMAIRSKASGTGPTLEGGGLDSQLGSPTQEKMPGLVSVLSARFNLPTSTPSARGMNWR